MHKKLLLLSIVMLLAGCSFKSIQNNGVIQNRNHEYLSARTIPPLKIPPGVAASSIKEEYPVPEKYYPEEAKQVSLIPPGLN
jgi:uncharacterized lipoprotein